MQQFAAISEVLKSLNQSLAQPSMKKAEYNTPPYMTWTRIIAGVGGRNEESKKQLLSRFNRLDQKIQTMYCKELEAHKMLT